MNIPFDEVVTRKEIDQELEYANEGWRTFFNMYYRLTSQKDYYGNQIAPQQLVDEIIFINNVYKDLTERIGKIVSCFPKG